jgi:exodeoxyribonuclease VII small subunit
MPPRKETYAQALARLEQIVGQIDAGELEIDQLAEKLKEANQLIAFCRDRLARVDGETEKLLSEQGETGE